MFHQMFFYKPRISKYYWTSPLPGTQIKLPRRLCLVHQDLPYYFLQSGWRYLLLNHLYILLRYNSHVNHRSSITDILDKGTIWQHKPPELESSCRLCIFAYTCLWDWRGDFLAIANGTAVRLLHHFCMQNQIYVFSCSLECQWKMFLFKHFAIPSTWLLSIAQPCWHIFILTSRVSCPSTEVYFVMRNIIGMQRR